jgi:DMSO/TMAO reductase YedYZ molybdopterin-dependent catalytic subunit
MYAARLSRLHAAAIGLLSVLVALATGHLLAGFADPGASPYLAVGNTAIDLAPLWLKDFAVRTFGTNDKPVLLAGMAVVLTLFGVLGGLLSRHRPWPGTALLAVLGVLGVLAVVHRPDLGQLAPLVPVAALAAAIAAFHWLHGKAAGAAVETAAEQAGRRLATAPVAASPARTGPARARSAWARSARSARAGSTPPPNPARRGLLVAAGATAAGAGIAGLTGQLAGSRVDVQASRRSVGAIRPAAAATAIPAGADFAADGTPPFLTANAEFYRIDTALVVPRVRASDWSMRVHGMVDRELTVRYDDLRNRELVEKTVTLTCVSNEVGGPYISTANFVGVPLRDVLDQAGVHAGADQLVSHSVDGWSCGSPTEVMLDPGRALLALAMNGEPLPAEHGFPVRLVVPGLYGYVSATKWLNDLELTTFDAVTPYWARRGWARRAPVKTMSRIDRPNGFQRVPAGRTVIAGIAWAQHRGVEAVEVRLDQGPWREATLATEVNLDTWRMWRLEVDVARGGHTVQVRATDKIGYTQTEQRADPVPDGATGWHTVSFSAT